MAEFCVESLELYLAGMELREQIDKVLKISDGSVNLAVEEIIQSLKSLTKTFIDDGSISQVNVSGKMANAFKNNTASVLSLQVDTKSGKLSPEQRKIIEKLDDQVYTILNEMIQLMRDPWRRFKGKQSYK